MKYSSKMAEKWCLWNLQFTIDKLNKHATEQSEKLSDLKKLQSRQSPLYSSATDALN